MSADAGSRRGSSSSTNGPPLARVQSAFSVPPKPKRLLNGRVYGAQKPPRNLSTNAFGNAPDEEPEFVEWGHGGMGSVRAGGMWAKVQSNQKLLIGHTEERGRRGIPAVSHVDEDDGGGMGWVKRRREERERNKLEEQAAGEATSNTNGVATSSPSSDATSPPSSTLVSVDRNVTTVTPSQLTPEEDDDSEDEEETVDDESSCTEQEDDDDSQVRHHFPSFQPDHHIQRDLSNRNSISSRSLAQVWNASAGIVIEPRAHATYINYCLYLSYPFSGSASHFLASSICRRRCLI